MINNTLHYISQQRSQDMKHYLQLQLEEQVCGRTVSDIMKQNAA
jgi:hypothetical protein